MKSDIKNSIQIVSYPQTDKETLTTDEIIELIEYFESSILPKFEDNNNFYIGTNEGVKDRVDENTPQNIINIPYARTMTSTVKGYMYKPGLITYSTPDTITENQAASEALYEEVTRIYKINHEDIVNAELGESQSKYGIGFELLYSKDVNGEVMPGLISLDAREVIPIYDYTIEKNMVCCIRYYKLKTITNSDEQTIKVEVYYKDRIEYYTMTILRSATGAKKTLTSDGNAENFYGDVPIIAYINNEELQADYEPVRSLIALYDKMFQSSANELDRFAAAYLVLKNYILAGDDVEASRKLEAIKRHRVFEVGENGEITFLTKDIPTQFFDSIKVSLREDIVYHSHVPDFRDEQFGTASGIAIKYKLIGFENMCADKEAYFKKGLEKRLRLLQNYLNIATGSNEMVDLEITFKRNLPEPLTDLIPVIQGLKGIVSTETLLKLLPFVTDIDAEKEATDAEKKANMEMFDFERLAGAKQTPPNKKEVETGEEEMTDE